MDSIASPTLGFPWGQLLVNIGLAGSLLVYLLVYDRPRQERRYDERDGAFTKSLTSLAESAAEIQRHLAQDFRDEMRLEREAHRAEHTDLRESIEALRNSVEDLPCRLPKDRSSRS